jgi:hypothetical protein
VTDVQAKSEALGQVFNAASLFFRNLDTEPFVDMQSDQEYARPGKDDRDPNLKWMGGDMATGPWVYWIDHPAGVKAAPHKHFAARIEYILEGEMEFFEGEEALNWHRGKPAKSTVHGPGTLSYVPSGQLYGYEITKPSKLLHVFFANPVNATQHFD